VFPYVFVHQRRGGKGKGIRIKVICLPSNCIFDKSSVPIFVCPSFLLHSFGIWRQNVVPADEKVNCEQGPRGKKGWKGNWVFGPASEEKEGAKEEIE
jgi:hypothetical protein